MNPLYLPFNNPPPAPRAPPAPPAFASPTFLLSSPTPPDPGGLSAPSKYSKYSLYLTPPVLSVSSIYLTQGLLGLTSLARQFLLKDSLHLEPSQTAALSGLFILPWTVKPLYGLLSDALPLFGSRRKSYLILAGLVASLCNLLLSLPSLRVYLHEAYGVPEAGWALSLLVLASACVALTDVVADGLVVAAAREPPAPGKGQVPLTGPNLQSLCWGSAAVGGILAAYGSGALVGSL
ncbi:hypothetical protein TeGR_g5299, partial [Tetraparma gracilis]